MIIACASNTIPPQSPTPILLFLVWTLGYHSLGCTKLSDVVQSKQLDETAIEISGLRLDKTELRSSLLIVLIQQIQQIQ